MTQTAGKLITADEAWFMFQLWEIKGASIGFMLTGKTGAVGARGKIVAGRGSTLQLLGDASRAVFCLENAIFTQGPVNLYTSCCTLFETERSGIQAHLSTGEWLILVEEMEPEWGNLPVCPN